MRPAPRATAGAALLAALIALAACQAVPPPGAWRAVDGDTLAQSSATGSARWRLHGIDAPELAQTCQDAAGADWPCGRAAQARLAQMIEGRAIECQAMGRDRYSRSLGRCWAIQADGSRIDLSAALTREGLALAYTRYSREHEADQAAAQAAGRGIWAGESQAPEDFRRDR